MISKAHAKTFQGKKVILTYFHPDDNKHLLSQKGKVNFVSTDNLFLMVKDGKREFIEVFGLDLIERIKDIGVFEEILNIIKKNKERIKELNSQKLNIEDKKC